MRNGSGPASRPIITWSSRTITTGAVETAIIGFVPFADRPIALGVSLIGGDCGQGSHAFAAMQRSSESIACLAATPAEGAGRADQSGGTRRSEAYRAEFRALGADAMADRCGVVGARWHGLLPLQLVSPLVHRPGQRLLALAAAERADYPRGGQHRHLSQNEHSYRKWRKTCGGHIMTECWKCRPETAGCRARLTAGRTGTSARPRQAIWPDAQWRRSGRPRGRFALPSRKARAAMVGSTPVFFHHAASSPQRWTSR